MLYRKMLFFQPEHSTLQLFWTAFDTFTFLNLKPVSENDIVCGVHLQAACADCVMFCPSPSSRGSEQTGVPGPVREQTGLVGQPPVPLLQQEGPSFRLSLAAEDSLLVPHDAGDPCSETRTKHQQTTKQDTVSVGLHFLRLTNTSECVVYLLFLSTGSGQNRVCQVKCLIISFSMCTPQKPSWHYITL